MFGSRPQPDAQPKSRFQTAPSALSVVPRECYEKDVPRWLEVTPHYGCNNRCLGCYSVKDEPAPDESMSSAEALDALRRFRAAGATSVWFGGGEPTLRRDLISLVRAARQLGYTRVKLQTNGMLLAYPEFTRRCVEAGVSDVNFAIKGATDAIHDGFTRTPGSFELLLRAIDQARRHGLALSGDVLVYRSTTLHIPALTAYFAGLGISHFNLWLLSAEGSRDPIVGAEVPRLSEVMPALVEAMDASAGRFTITSLHTPACVVPATHHRALFHAAALDMVVVNPGGHHFKLETSPIEGGVFLERCASCSARNQCNGLRADYLRRYGDEEFNPLRA